MLKRKCVQAFGALVVMGLAIAQGTENIQTFDLKPVLGQWPFSNLGADWMLPSGNQVLDGVPFQIDGLVLLNASNSVQRARPGRDKIEHIVVGRRFELLHLLAATDSDGKDGMLAGIVRVHYGDSSDAALGIRYGEHLLHWLGGWYTKAAPCLSHPK